MKISFLEKKPTEASIIVSIERADYQVRVASKMEEYRKRVLIKGFRPGSVPSAVIQKMYGRTILLEELNTLLDESLAKYLMENKIYALGEPMLVSKRMEEIDWEDPCDFEFEYIIGMPGTVSYELSKSIQVTAYRVSHVAEETLDDLVEQLRKTYGKTDMVSKSAVDDVVHGELLFLAQNFKKKTKIVLKELSEEGRNIFTDLAPKDNITFEYKQAFEESTKLPGVTKEMHAIMLRLDGPVRFTVERIHRCSPAALEQDFFDKVLGSKFVGSEQEFRNELRTRILRNKQKKADLFFEQSVRVAILEKSNIPLPDHFLMDWLQKKNGAASRDQIEMYYQQYAKELRWALLVAAIDQKYHLQVTHEEVVREVRDQLEGTAESNEVVRQLSEEHMEQLIQKFLRENSEKNYRQVYEKVHAQKCINFMKDQITVLVREISVEQFDQPASEQLFF